LETLKNKAVNGFIWSFIDSFGVYFIKLSFTIAIARLLTPSDYGLIGMITIFIAISGLMSESGFTSALIQKKDVTKRDYSTVFWSNIIIAIVTYGILFLSAGSIADFFAQPQLKQIIRIASLGIILNALSLVQFASLWKELKFKQLMIINACSALVAGVIGLVCAYLGFRYWSLVVMTLAQNITKTILLWILIHQVPAFIFSLHSFRSLFSYGYKVFLQNLSDVVFTNSFYLVIGKRFSLADVGYYANADKFRDIMVRQTTWAFTKVSFPAFSAISGQPDRFRANYLKTFRLICFLMFPFLTIIISVIKPFVIFFMTPKWLPAVPFMYLFFIEGFYYPLLMLNQNIFNALGKSGLALRLDILKYTLVLISIFITFRLGISALIIGQLSSSFIVLILNSVVVSSLLMIKFKNLLLNIVPIIVLSAIVICFNLFILTKFIIHPLALVTVQTIFAIVFYLGMSMIIQMKAYREFIDLFQVYLPAGIAHFIRK
jgi:teichuronic acid exporter